MKLFSTDLYDRPAPELIGGDDVVTEGSYVSFATFSTDRVYRYVLGRVWNDYAPFLVVGMLNPSKAGADENDPTVRRVLAFAHRDRFGGLLVWNAAALVSTDPSALKGHTDPVGPRNYQAIQTCIGRPPLAKSVVAWGAPKNKTIGRILGRTYVQAASCRPLWRFGEPTKAGHPRHPLYLRSDTPIVRHDGRITR